MIEDSSATNTSRMTKKKGGSGEAKVRKHVLRQNRGQTNTPNQCRRTRNKGAALIIFRQKRPHRSEARNRGLSTQTGGVQVTSRATDEQRPRTHLTVRCKMNYPYIYTVVQDNAEVRLPISVRGNRFHNQPPPLTVVVVIPIVITLSRYHHTFPGG